MSNASEVAPRLAVSLDIISVEQGAALQVTYRVENPFDQEVLLFDRRWNASRKAFDPAWIDVTFEGDLAVLARMRAPRPEGALGAPFATPYGRLLKPGATSETVVQLPLPLRERGPWLAETRAALAPDEPTRAEIRRVELRLGWCVLRDRGGLSEGHREGVERDGERLFAIPDDLVESAQGVMVSPQYRVALDGERYAGGML